MDDAAIVKRNYDANVELEWGRLERHKIEFEITKRFLTRYVRPGQKLLDVGGGPGRYSLFFAEQGCDVTLADLSDGNVAFAREKARELGLPLRAVQADARDLSALAGERFDHVLVMGPLYHLTGEEDREQAVQQAMGLLKPGGTLACAFISSYAGMIYYMKDAPQMIAEESETVKQDIEQFLVDAPFAGMAFTQAYFARRDEILPFFDRFALEKLHFLAAEGILAPCENIIMAQPPHVVDAWIDIAAQVCERPDLMSFAEHFLYIGRKQL